MVGEMGEGEGGAFGDVEVGLTGGLGEPDAGDLVEHFAGEGGTFDAPDAHLAPAGGGADIDEGALEFIGGRACWFMSSTMAWNWSADSPGRTTVLENMP